jgi:hypothetical protein
LRTAAASAEHADPAAAERTTASTRAIGASIAARAGILAIEATLAAAATSTRSMRDIEFSSC